MKRPEETEAYWEQYSVDSRQMMATHFQLLSAGCAERIREELAKGTPDAPGKAAELMAGMIINSYWQGYYNGLSEQMISSEHVLRQAECIRDAARAVIREATGDKCTAYYDFEEQCEAEDGINE